MILPIERSALTENIEEAVGAGIVRFGATFAFHFECTVACMSSIEIAGMAKTISPVFALALSDPHYNAEAAPPFSVSGRGADGLTTCFDD